MVITIIAIYHKMLLLDKVMIGGNADSSDDK